MIKNGANTSSKLAVPYPINSQYQQDSADKRCHARQGIGTWRRCQRIEGVIKKTTDFGTDYAYNQVDLYRPWLPVLFDFSGEPPCNHSGYEPDNKQCWIHHSPALSDMEQTHSTIRKSYAVAIVPRNVVKFCFCSSDNAGLIWPKKSRNISLLTFSVSNWS